MNRLKIILCNATAVTALIASITILVVLAINVMQNVDTLSLLLSNI